MKLTNAIRDQIVENALRKSEIPGRRASLKASIKTFALNVYNTAVVPTIPEILMKAINNPIDRELVRGWLTWASGITLTDIKGEWDDSRHYNDHEGIEGRWPSVLDSVLKFDDPKLIPRYQSSIDLGKYPQLMKIAKGFHETHLETNALEHELTQNLRGIVRSANTKAQLLAIWPEAATLIPGEIAPTQALVPVDAVLALNKALGLSK